MRTKKDEPLIVSSQGDSASSVVVPLDELDEVLAMFKKNHFPHDLDEEALSHDRKRDSAFIQFGSGVDTTAVQNALDQMYSKKKAANNPKPLVKKKPSKKGNKRGEKK